MVTFRASWTRRIDEFVFAAMFLVLLGLSLTLHVGSPQERGVQVFSLVLWTTMSTMALYMILFSVCEISISPDRIALRSFVRQADINRSEMKSVTLTHTGRSGRVLFKTADGRGYFLYYKSFAEAPAMAAALQPWTTVEKVPSTVRCNRKGAATSLICMACFLFAIVIAAGFGMRNSLLPVVILGVIALFMLGLGVAALGSFAIASPEGLHIKLLGKENYIAWDSVDRASLFVQRSKSSRFETLSLQANGKKLRISDSWDGFGHLRDIALAHIPPDRLVDNRPSY